MKRGFSLFEVLLVLLIISMIVVGGIEYAARKNEVAAAEQLGHRLYLYGMAVADYARQNPEKLTETTEHYGVDWLKAIPNPENCTDPNDLSTCKNFLSQDFNLHFQSILIESFAGAPNAADAQIYTKLVPEPSPSLALDVELIQLGRVVKYSKDAQQYEVDASLSTRAVNFANNYSDQLGTALISYTMSSYDQAGYIIGGPSTLGTGVDYGYLLTNGGNEMKASIRFADSAVEKNIEGVDEIVFTPKNGVTSQIDRMQNMGSSTLTGFPPESSDGSQGLMPIYGSDDFMVYRRDNGISWMELQIKDGSGYHTVNNSVCFLSGMQKAGSGGNDICRVTPGTRFSSNSGINWVLYLNKGQKTNDTSSCYARCLLFNE